MYIQAMEWLATGGLLTSRLVTVYAKDKRRKKLGGI